MDFESYYTALPLVSFSKVGDEAMTTRTTGGQNKEILDELTARMKAGEPGAVLELWEAVRRFVEMKARERVRAGSRVPLEDLTQAGFLAVLDAADQYDPGRENASFLSLLCFTIQNRWAEEAGTRSSKRDVLQYAISADATAYPDDPDGPTVVEGIPDNSAALAFMGVEYADFLDYCRGVIGAALETLTENQADILRLHYLEGRSPEEIARLRGLSCGQSVRDAEIRAFYRLEHGKYRLVLRKCLEAFEDFHDYYFAAHSSSIDSFMRSRTSSTEAAALVKIRM